MQRNHLAKNSGQFLQKFQGRKNMVGKEGLLHLLQAKRQSIARYQQASPVKGKIVLRKLNNINPDAPLSSHNSQKLNSKGSASSHQKNIKNATSHTQEAGHRYSRQPKSQQLLSNRIKLPSINKSSQSMSLKQTSQSAHKSQILGPKSPMRVSQQSLVLNNVSKKIQLDHYAMRHLHFLQKFQRQLLLNPLGKQTSRSQDR